MADDTYIQVAPDSTGKKVRNLQITTVDDTGTQNTVEMQVVAVADANGRLLDLSEPTTIAMLTEIRTELRILAFLLTEGFGLKADFTKLRNDEDFTGDRPT